MSPQTFWKVSPLEQGLEALCAFKSTSLLLPEQNRSSAGLALVRLHLVMVASEDPVPRTPFSIHDCMTLSPHHLQGKRHLKKSPRGQTEGSTSVGKTPTFQYSPLGHRNTKLTSPHLHSDIWAGAVLSSSSINLLGRKLLQKISLLHICSLASHPRIGLSQQEAPLIP